MGIKIEEATVQKMWRTPHKITTWSRLLEGVCVCVRASVYMYTKRFLYLINRNYLFHLILVIAFSQKIPRKIDHEQFFFFSFCLYVFEWVSEWVNVCVYCTRHDFVHHFNEFWSYRLYVMRFVKWYRHAYTHREKRKWDKISLNKNQKGFDFLLKTLYNELN